MRSRRGKVKKTCPLSRKLKLLSIKKSPKKDKKLRASFCKNGKIRHVDFGAKGYSDYTIHKTLSRKRRYIQRHRSRENWKDPMGRGTLSLYVLWNKPSLKKSIEDYKRRFKL